MRLFKKKQQKTGNHWGLFLAQWNVNFNLQKGSVGVRGSRFQERKRSVRPPPTSVRGGPLRPGAGEGAASLRASRPASVKVAVALWPASRCGNIWWQLSPVSRSLCPVLSTCCASRDFSTGKDRNHSQLSWPGRESGEGWEGGSQSGNGGQLALMHSLLLSSSSHVTYISFKASLKGDPG